MTTDDNEQPSAGDVERAREMLFSSPGYRNCVSDVIVQKVAAALTAARREGAELRALDKMMGDKPVNTTPPYIGKRLIPEKRRSQNAYMPWFKQNTDLDICREQLAAAQKEIARLSELRALDHDTIARVLHEAHKPWCDYTYPFEHPMSSREVYEALADAVIAARDAAIRARTGEE